MKINTINQLSLLLGSLAISALLLAGNRASAQNLFVSTYGGQNIVQITPGGSPSVFAPGMDFPTALVFNNAGDLFVANSANNNGETGNITEITPGGAQSTFYSGVDAQGLAFNSAGNLFQADYRTGNIYEYTTGGVQSTFATGLPNPIMLAFNKVGNLFVSAGYGNGQGFIDEITTGGVTNLFAAGLSFPNGLAFNNAGNLFVSSQTSGTIYEYTPGGVQSTFITLPAGSINGLAFDSAGDLFAAAGAGTIYEVTPGGTESTFASISYPADELAFQPVPEPATLALAGWGAGTILMLRRRK
jgi:sugar lactone lactonase YvrE